MKQAYFQLVTMGEAVKRAQIFLSGLFIPAGSLAMGYFSLKTEETAAIMHVESKRAELSDKLHQYHHARAVPFDPRHPPSEMAFRCSKNLNSAVFLKEEAEVLKNYCDSLSVVTSKAFLAQVRKNVDATVKTTDKIDTTYLHLLLSVSHQMSEQSSELSPDIEISQTIKHDALAAFTSKKKIEHIWFKSGEIDLSTLLCAYLLNTALAGKDAKVASVEKLPSKVDRSLLLNFAMTYFDSEGFKKQTGRITGAVEE